MLDNPKNDQTQDQSDAQITDDQAKGGQATTDFNAEVVEDTDLDDTEKEETKE